MRLYAYCLAEHIDPPAEPVSGISGARVDVLRIEGFSLLVSEFEGDKVQVTRENALAHAAVVRSILNETTPLPFRFGTLADEEQLRTYVTSHRAALQNNLAHVRDAVEMSVKIIWSTDQPDVSAGGPGARFLKQKQLRAAHAKDVAAWLQEQVRPVAKDEQVSLGSTDKLIVSAAHLVDRGSVAAYRGQLVEARKTRPELHFLVSGPWPPYSFSNIELEFKTRFGVS